MSQDKKYLTLFKKFDSYVYYLKNSYEINGFLFVTLLFISFLALVPSVGHKYSYKVGDIATSDIKSPKDLSVYNQEATEKIIEKVKAQALPVFDMNLEILENIKEKISILFEKSRKNLPLKKDELESLKIEFEQTLNFPMNPKDFNILVKNKFSDELEWLVIKLISNYMNAGVVCDNCSVFKYNKKGIILRNLSTNEDKIVKNYTVYKISEIKKLLTKNYFEIAGQIRQSSALKKLVINIAASVIKPNLQYNKDESQDRVTAMVNSVEPIYYVLKKNEIIVREGSRITPETLIKINAIKDDSSFYKVLKKSLSILILFALFAFIIYRMFIYDLNEGYINGRDVLLFLVVIALSFLTFRIMFIISNGLSESFKIGYQNIFYLMIPFAFPSILLKIFINEKYAFASVLLISFLSYMLGGHTLFLYTLLGGLFVIIRIKCCYERFTFIKLGLDLGLFNTIIILGLNFFIDKTSILSFDIIFLFFSGIFNGFLNAVLLLGVIPIFEYTFRYTSDLRLLELGNLENPLLKEFSEKAPGSYQHSILVSRLAETAAKEIGVNSLLAKVASFYHDIGKINKPLYFIENQDAKLNKHKNLTPNMSALIIISHVKDGVELGRKHKLGDEIIDVIEQHHGTGLIKYFYKKAIELSESGMKDEIDEKNFRYPGKKPSSKEAGIIMIADIIEAASRTLQDPTSSRLKGLVKTLIENILNDGQLDESKLTLKELTLIRNSMINTLNSIFHQRIEYPK